MIGMVARISFSGPARYRFRNVTQLGASILQVGARRIFKGARRPGWNWFLEVATNTLKRQLDTSFKMKDAEKARRYLNSLTIDSPALSQVTIRELIHEKFKGTWFVGKNTEPSLSVLYFHGGGYSFYPKAYSGFVAQLTLAAKSRTFALDYRLAPEHRFPAQLEDGLNAYLWLLKNDIDPTTLIIIGDSAGGHLALSLLLKLKAFKYPLPALAIALSPPTNFEDENVGEAELDWIDKRALLVWKSWFCGPAQARDPLLSLSPSDARGLPPIYIQAGRAEILYPSIEAFCESAKIHGGDVVLESWEDMNHDFQVFAPYVPQSVDALQRIGEVIDVRVRRSQSAGPRRIELAGC